MSFQLGYPPLQVEVKECSECPFYFNPVDCGFEPICEHPSYPKEKEFNVDYYEPPPAHCPGFLPVVIKVLE